MPPAHCSVGVDSVSVATVCTDNPSLPGGDILLVLCCSPSASSLFSPLSLNLRASCHESFCHQIYNFVLCIKCNLSINVVKNAFYSHIVSNSFGTVSFMWVQSMTPTTAGKPAIFLNSAWFLWTSLGRVGKRMNRVTTSGLVSAWNTCVMARLMVGCVGPNLSLLHSCTLLVKRYLKVSMSFSSAERDLFLDVRLVIPSLIKSVTNKIPARSILYLLMSSRSSYISSGSFLGEKFGRCGITSCCSAIITMSSSYVSYESLSTTHNILTRYDYS